MATLRTVTVGPGKDYSSLASAESGEQGDLVSLDRQLDIECYSFEDTTAVVFDGWTTDATRYIRVFTPSAERHDGKWNTSKYRIVASSMAAVVDCLEDYMRFEGLQIDNTGTGFSSVGFRMSSGVDVRLHSSVVRGARFTIRGLHGSGTLQVRNTVAYGGTAGSVALATNGTINLQNCTVIGGTNGINQSGAGTLTATNCYVHGSTEAYTFSFITLTTCAHSSATSFTGSTASVAHSMSNFVNVTAGSQDYHLVTGSALIDAGTDLSGTFTTDIDGATRSGTWDIGADEFDGGGATFQAAWASGSNVILAGAVY